MVVVWRQAIFAEARREIRVGHLTDFIRRGESRAAKLFGMLGRRDVGRTRMPRVSKAALER
jgi:hypothetical protein